LIKTLFFDNDGVLVDTEHLYFAANKLVLAQNGQNLSLTQFADISLRQGQSVIRNLLPGRSRDELNSLHQQRDQLYSELLQSEPISVPCVEEQLNELRQRFRMAIVTSSRREHFDIIHSRLNLLKHFDFVLTREDYSASKPDPDPYLAAIRRCGEPPDNCLVIEDTPRGLRSALAAGLECIVIPNRLLDGTDFELSCHRISTFGELLPFLLQQSR
jgi:HAD superfamily hydrolase (TIGR01509 family)